MVVRVKTEQLAGLILAGGEGKRFGGPKAWAKLPDGRTFLEACAKTLIDAGASPLVATLPPGTGDPAIVGLNAIPLPASGLDMFASLKIGLEILMKSDDWQWAAVLPVDHPLAGAETVRALALAGSAAVIPSFNGKHGHPVCVARSVVEKIVGGELKGPTLREVLRTVGAVNVPVNDPGVVSNCNTPEALRKALARHR
jgi:CTP:molybdopterin cytidylyltransferase MocA